MTYEAPKRAAVSIVLTPETGRGQLRLQVSIDLTPAATGVQEDIYVSAGGLVGEGYGVPGVVLHTRYVIPVGVSSSMRVGTARAWLPVRFVSPAGGIYSAYGTTRAQLKDRRILLSGGGFFSAGRPVFSLRDVYVYPAGAAHVIFGAASLTDGRRYIRAPSLPLGMGVSKTSWVSNARRQLYIAGVRSEVFGGHRISDRVFYPVPTGFVATIWGNTRVENQHRSYSIVGIDSARLGTVSARNNVRYIFPRWVFSFSSGYGRIGAAIRYLSEATGGDNFLSGARHVIGPWHVHAPMRGFDSAYVNVYTSIKDARQTVLPRSYVIPDFVAPHIQNRDRYLTPAIFWSPQSGLTTYGRAWVQSSTRNLRPMRVGGLQFGLGTAIHFYVGDVDLATIGESSRHAIPLVAYRIRYLPLGGWQASRVSTTVLVRNAAFPLRPSGGVHTLTGSPEVELKNRNVRAHPLLSSNEQWPSVVQVTDGIRGLEVGAIRGASYVAVGLRIWLGTRFVAVQGIEPYRTVRYETEVVSRFNIIRQLWKYEHVDLVSSPQIHTYNREIRTWMVDQTEYGRARVELGNREFEISTGLLLQFGGARIADRVLRVNQALYGIRAPEFNRQRIEKLMSDPPFTRLLEVRTGIFHYELKGEESRFGEAKVGVQLIENVGVGVTFEPGEHGIFNNSIILEHGILYPPMGSPTVSPFYIRPESMDFTIMAGPNPRINPYHIFAAEGDRAPPAYRPFDLRPIDNHVVDGRMYTIPGSFLAWDTSKNAGGWVPRPIVTHWVQNRRMSGSDMSRIPNVHSVVRVYNPGTLRIYPKGFTQHRIGWLRFPPDLIQVQSTLMTRYGTPGVRISRYLAEPVGFGLSVAGKPVVDYYHRFIRPIGVRRDIFGTAWAADRVRGFKARSFTGTQKVGTAFIAYRNRVLEVEGGFYFNPQAAMGGLPTSVKNKYTGRVLSAKPLVPSAPSIPDIAFWTKWIQPRGLLTYPVSRVKVVPRATIYALGTEHSVFGTVRKWEEGVVYPHELVSSSVNSPRVTGTKLIQGFSSSLVNYPTIAGHIGAYGTPKETFGATVVKNEICCGGCG